MGIILYNNLLERHKENIIKMDEEMMDPPMDMMEEE